MPKGDYGRYKAQQKALRLKPTPVYTGTYLTLRNGKSVDTGLLRDDIYLDALTEGVEVLYRSGSDTQKADIEEAIVILPKPKRRPRNERP